MPAHRPWVGRKFGVEMEMNQITIENVDITQQRLREACRAGVLAVGGDPASRVNAAPASYYHSNGRTWDVKTDSSCGVNDGIGWEVAAPALMLDDEAQCPELQAVTQQLKLIQPRIDRACGLHVHVEVRDYDWRDLQRLVTLWLRYEPFFFELCPRSRRTNRFCVPLRKTDWARPDDANLPGIVNLINAGTEHDARQMSINVPRGAIHLAHFWRSHRIEFRLAAGTVEYEKIVRWTQLLLSFVARVKQASWGTISAREFSNRPISVQFVAKVLGLAPGHVPASDIPEASRALVTWMEQRRAQFVGTESDNPIDQAVAREPTARGRRL